MPQGPNTEEEERLAFWDWMDATEGYWTTYFTFLTMEVTGGWQNSDLYNEWVSAGRPSEAGFETSFPDPRAQGVMAGIPGMQEAFEYGYETGDWSQLDAIMDSLREVQIDAAAEDPNNIPELTSFRIHEEGGAVFFIPLDAEGNDYIAGMEFLFQSPEGGMDAFQAEQVENWAANVALGYAQIEAQNLRHTAELGLSRDELAEQVRQFDIEMGFSREQLEWEKERFAEELGLSREQLGLERERLAWQKEAEAARIALAEKQHLAQLKAHPSDWIEAYQFEKGQPPPAPTWLPQFAPGVGTQQITPVGTKTPSGQMYGKMPWGQREMLGGYAEYANVPGTPQNIQEIEGRISRMLPREREKASRWQPARQV